MDKPVAYSVALVIICLIVIGILWLPDILKSD